MTDAKWHDVLIGHRMKKCKTIAFLLHACSNDVSKISLGAHSSCDAMKKTSRCWMAQHLLLLSVLLEMNSFFHLIQFCWLIQIRLLFGKENVDVHIKID